MRTGGGTAYTGGLSPPALRGLRVRISPGVPINNMEWRV